MSQLNYFKWLGGEIFGEDVQSILFLESTALTHIRLASFLCLPCQKISCADLEFCQRGPTLTVWGIFGVFLGGIFLVFLLVDEGRKDPNEFHCKRAIIGPPPKRHLNGVSMAC